MPEALPEAAALAAQQPPSAGPRAAAPPHRPVAAADGVVEQPGEGLSCPSPNGEIRLGSARFCGLSEQAAGSAGTVAVAARPCRRSVSASPSGCAPTRSRRSSVCGGWGCRSGCSPATAPHRWRGVADALGIARLARRLHARRTRWPPSPAGEQAGERVLMVGDGLNDGPALAAASVSASPSTAADLSQTVADLVYQGSRLGTGGTGVATARRARRVMRQNLASGARLQCADGAAGDGRPGDAVAGGGGDVAVVAAGDGQ